MALFCLFLFTQSVYATNLYSNSFLNSGESVSGGIYSLYMNPDGNLEFINTNTGTVIWSSTTARYINRRSSLAMQGDGNLVIYRETGEPIWASGTQGNNGSRLAVQGDGNLVIYNSQNSAIWSSRNTPWGAVIPSNQILLPGDMVDSISGSISLFLQHSGTLVLLNNYTGEIVWYAQNSGAIADWAIMQDH